MAKKIVIARIASPYGLKGWVKLQSFTEPKTNVCSYTQGWLKLSGQEDWQTYQAQIKASHNTILLKLADYNDPESARKLNGALLGVLRDQLPVLAIDEYYWSDLEGLKVVTTSGTYLGTLDHFIPTGANDVMLVKNDKQVHLIPYIDDVICQVDLKNQQLIVDWSLEF